MTRKKLISFAFVALLTAVPHFTQAQQGIPRYYVVPSENLGFLPTQVAPHVLAKIKDLNLVKMDAGQIYQLSRAMHENKSVCGGFLDVQVQMETKGMNAPTVLQWAATRPEVLHQFDKRLANHPQEVEAMLKLVSQNRYGQFLKEFTSFSDRYAAGPLGVKASQFLANRAAALAQAHERTDIMIRNIPTGGRFVQDSVLVRIPGTNSKLPGVLLGGHMDTYENNKPGVDDDGTGTATVMEIYNAVLDSRLKFERDLYFAFYAAEEWGLYGSQKVANEFQQRKIPMRAVLQYDMTGFKSPKDSQEIYFVDDHVDTNLTTFLKELAVTYVKLPAEMIGKTHCGYACSDHASWTNAGYSSAFPFEASFQNDNKSIHTGRDTFEFITPAHVMNFVKLGAAFAVESAEPVSRR